MKPLPPVGLWEFPQTQKAKDNPNPMAQYPRHIVCLGCGYLMNWYERRIQFGRLVKRLNVTPEEAKRLMPRCSRCISALFRPPRHIPQQAFHNDEGGRCNQ
jgi:hypothetical protein